MITTNITGDPEIKDSALAFEMPEKTFGGTETLIDEFDATVYMGARLTATVTNEFGQIEINEFMIIHDNTNAYIRNLATLNNIDSNRYVSIFRAELFRGFVRIFVTGTGNRNCVRFFKIMFKK